MKKLFFVMSALAALSLLAPSAGVAAWNQIGMYTDQAADPASSVFMGAGSFDAYLIVTDPVNEAWAGTTPPTVRPMDSVFGFECQIIIPTDGIFKLSAVFPGQALNVGTEPDWIVGFAAPLPVPDTANHATELVHFSFLLTDSNAKEIFLAPSSVPSFPGTMALADGSLLDDNLQKAYPATGAFANPIFSINTDTAVAVENASLGSVKALFR